MQILASFWILNLKNSYVYSIVHTFLGEQFLNKNVSNDLWLSKTSSVVAVAAKHGDHIILFKWMMNAPNCILIPDGW